KSVEAIQQELARSYNGNLTNDLTQTPTDLAETKAIQIGRASYRERLQSKQPANANEKQAIETELASIESRLSELKQTEIAFNETKNNATNLAQCTTHVSTAQLKSVEAIQQELARSYNGNLTNDLTQTPTDLAETKAI